ncbi:MAG: hypothetical protein IID34_01110 [Planctomycetes bacterium]|nr:hypothetical protein [Planctomycetota bacterium]
MTRRVMVLALLVLLNGCVGPQFLKVQRYKYNEAIQESTAQQLLLNIVRLRYNDSPMFLNVGDIDARFSLDATSMASGTINENVGAAPLNANSATVTASSKFTNNPNIKLRPMQDADFARLLEPLTSDEMLALATRRGSLYEYLALAMQSYTYTEEPEDGDSTKPEDGDSTKPEDGDNTKPEDGDKEETVATEITVDAYRDTPKWIEFLTQLKEDDKNGELLIKSKMVEEEFLPSYAACEIEVEDVINATLAGLEFKKKKKHQDEKDEDEKDEDEKDEDEYVLVRASRKWTMKVDVEPQVKRKVEREFRYHFSQDSDSESRGEDKEPIEDKERIDIRFRSIVQMMYCLSLGVDVPSPHKPEWDEKERDGLSADSGILAFEVMSDDHPPNDHVAFVSVKYRGHWFYIKRTHKESKKFFSVLTELFVERAGKAATTPTILPL